VIRLHIYYIAVSSFKEDPESQRRTSKVALITHGPSARHIHGRWASGGGGDS